MPALLGTALWLIVGCNAGQSGEFRARAAVDSLMKSALESGQLVGASVSIAEGSDLVFVGSYGLADLEAAVPVTRDTRFNVASVGKIIASATVMRLVDDDLVSLDDEAAAFLPDLEDEPSLEGVRLGHLLNMTSGLSDYVQADLARWETTRAPLEPAFVLDHVRTEQRLFDPGSEWMYSNTGFYLAGLIVEQVMGRSWGDFVTEDVLPELGLDRSGLCDEAGSERSIGYQATDSGFVRSVQDQETGVRGDAGICATTSDIALLPTRLRGGALSPEALSSMLSPTRLENGTVVDYGYGVSRGRLFGRPLWGHLGGAGSLVAVLMHFESDDISITLAVNTRDASLGALVLIAEVARVVLPMGDAGPTTEAPPEQLLSQLVGTYIGDRSRTSYSVSLDGGTLGIRSPDSTVPLIWREELEFGRDDWPLDRFRFHIVDGRVTGFSAYYNGLFDGYRVRRD